MAVPAPPAEPRIRRLLTCDIAALAHHTGLPEGYRSVMLCATVSFHNVVGRQLFGRALRTSAAAGGAWWLGARIDVSEVGNEHIRDVLRQVLLRELLRERPGLAQVLEDPAVPASGKIFSINYHYQLACRNFSDTVPSNTPPAAGGPNFPEELVIREPELTAFDAWALNISGVEVTT